MTAKKIAILLNVALAALLGVFLVWDLRELESVGGVPVAFDQIPLYGLKREVPPRLPSIKNLFGLKALKTNGEMDESKSTVQEIQTPVHIIRLDGIIVSGSNRTGILSLTAKGGLKTAAPERRKIHKDDVVLDYTVQEVESDRVLLFNRATNETIELVIFKKNSVQG